MFEAVDCELKKIVFLDEFLEDVFTGVSEEGGSGVGVEDCVYYFDALAVVSYFL